MRAHPWPKEITYVAPQVELVGFAPAEPVASALYGRLTKTGVARAVSRTTLPPIDSAALRARPHVAVGFQAGRLSRDEKIAMCSQMPPSQALTRWRRKRVGQVSQPALGRMTVPAL
jgi:hypothetical protein